MAWVEGRTCEAPTIDLDVWYQRALRGIARLARACGSIPPSGDTAEEDEAPALGAVTRACTVSISIRAS